MSQKTIRSENLSAAESQDFKIVPRVVVDVNTTFGNHAELKSAESGSMLSNSSRAQDIRFSDFLHLNGPELSSRLETGKSVNFKKTEDISTDSPTKRSELLQNMLSKSKKQLQQETLRELEDLQVSSRDDELLQKNAIKS